mmetsp:Transcript_65693/g.182865  ORF Transcript_65693/g.182865 Transcript_65693/m.182865 type:complete len:205 (-) Transcript_65693:742-1356(-)
MFRFVHRDVKRELRASGIHPLDAWPRQLFKEALETTDPLGDIVCPCTNAHATLVSLAENGVQARSLLPAHRIQRPCFGVFFPQDLGATWGIHLTCGILSCHLADLPRQIRARRGPTLGQLLGRLQHVAEAAGAVGHPAKFLHCREQFPRGFNLLLRVCAHVGTEEADLQGQFFVHGVVLGERLPEACRVLPRTVGNCSHLVHCF